MSAACRGRVSVGLHDHVVLLAVALVAGHDAAAEHGLERARDRVDADARVGRALAVDVDADLRLVQLQVGVDLHEARVLRQFGRELLRTACDRFS